MSSGDAICGNAIHELIAFELSIRSKEISYIALTERDYPGYQLDGIAVVLEGKSIDRL